MFLMAFEMSPSCFSDEFLVFLQLWRIFLLGALKLCLFSLFRGIED